MDGAKKGANSEGRLIVWIDEAGFRLLPGVARTWSARGETPVLCASGKRDHLSTIGALTDEGGLHTMNFEGSVDSVRVVKFLRHLLRITGRRLLVVWDNATIHKSKEVKSFLAEGTGTDAAGAVRLLALPPYSPQLNPIELVWRYLKHVELGSVCCLDLDELWLELSLAIRRFRRQVDILKSFLRKPGYI